MTEQEKDEPLAFPWHSAGLGEPRERGTSPALTGTGDAMAVHQVAPTLRAEYGEKAYRGDGADPLVVAPTLRGFGHGWQGQQNSTHAVLHPGSPAPTPASSPASEGSTSGSSRRAGRRSASPEVDDYANAVLAERWPGVPNLGDVVALAERWRRSPDGPEQRRDGQRGERDPRDRPAADGDAGHGDPAWQRATLWSGGFPCQDLSVAGKRRGLRDAEGDATRSGLAFAFLHLVERFRPPLVLLENVPGLLSSHRGKDLGALLGILGELGYGWAFRVLDARYFGVAQRRKRVFIVGSLGTDGASEVLLGAESGAWDPAPRRAPREAAGPAAGREPDDGRGRLAPTTDVVGTLSPGAHPGGANGQDAYTGQLIPVLGHSLNARRGRYDPDTDTIVAGTLNARDAKGLGFNGADDKVVVARGLTAERGQRNNGTEQNFVVAGTVSARQRGDRGDGGGQLVVGALGSVTSGGRKTGPDEAAAGQLVVAPTLRVGGRASGAGSSYGNTPIVRADGPAPGGGPGRPVAGGERGRPDADPAGEPDERPAGERVPGGGEPGAAADPDGVRAADGLAGGPHDRELLAFRPTGGTHSVESGPLAPSLKVGSGLGIPSPPAVAWVKSRRAQSDEDDETWVEADVAPTLNAFDVGEVRSTTLVEGEPAGEYADDPKGLDSNRYRVIGNGVVAPVARWLGERLRRAAEEWPA